MRIEELLRESGLEKLDAEVLLAHVLECNRTELITKSEETLKEEIMNEFFSLAKRRKDNEPTAYLIGKKEFYGAEFLVNEHVLIPRPATEGLIDATVDFLKDSKDNVNEIDSEVVAICLAKENFVEPRVVVDIGTGSGCIAITLARLLPEYSILATDISKKALEVAQKNAEHHKQDITFFEGKNLEPILVQEPFIIVSNPPYIPTNQNVMSDVADYEPHTALFSGVDGADVLRVLTKQAKEDTYCQGIVFECQENHVEIVKELWYK